MWCVEAQIAHCMQKTGHANAISHWRKTNNLNRRSKSKCTAIEIINNSSDNNNDKNNNDKNSSNDSKTKNFSNRKNNSKKYAHICALASIRFRKRKKNVQSILNSTLVQYLYSWYSGLQMNRFHVEALTVADVCFICSDSRWKN